MKRIVMYASLFLAVIVSACKSDDKEGTDPHAEKIGLVTSGVWQAESVIHSTDGDLTFQYEDFTITFTNNATSGSDGDFLVQNGGNAFPDASGKWSLNSDLNTISLSNGQDMTIENLSSQSLVLKFIVAPSAGGRIEGVSGEFTFHLEH